MTFKSRAFMSTAAVVAALVPWPATAQVSNVETWPQFRGPEGAAVAPESAPLPSEFGPAKNLLWKTPVPAGHSSPVVWGDRIFLTAFDTARRTLEVIALNRETGAILWRRDVSATTIETVHQISSPATATPAVDGERVYAYFGSYGVVAYDFNGNEQWSVPMPPVQVPFGSGTSPVVAGELVIVDRHEAKAPFLIALDRKSGSTAWKRDHPVPTGIPQTRGSHATPLIARGQAIVHSVGRIEAFDLATGSPVWWVVANTTGASTPVVSGDTLYAATWNPFGEADQRASLPDFAALVSRADRNGNGTISRDEVPADLFIFSRPDTPTVPGAAMAVAGSFAMFDANKDGELHETEWASATKMIGAITAEHGLIAVKLGGSGDVTATNVAWKATSSVPEVPSPLVYRDRVYIVRNGGILSSFEAATGKPIFRARVRAPGPYFASPVAADDKLFVASGDGVVVVLAPRDELAILASNDLGEPIFASPAVSRGVLYVRTASALYAFKQQ